MRAARAAAFTLLLGLATALDRAARVARYAGAGLWRREDLRADAIARSREFAGPDFAVTPPGLMRWEAAVYDRVLRAGDRILLVGCGTGRDLIALLERGHAVAGVDLVPEVVAAARVNLARRGLAAPLAATPIEDYQADDGFDVVVFSWSCYSAVPERTRRVATLRALRAHLSPGGRVVISYVPRWRGPHPWLLAATRLVARLTGSDWHAEPGDALTLAPAPWIGHYEHRFTEAEIVAEGRDAGYEVLEHVRDEATRDVPVLVLRRD